MNIDDKQKLHMILEYLQNLESRLNNDRKIQDNYARWYGYDEVHHLEGIIILSRINQFEQMSRVIYAIIF